MLARTEQRFHLKPKRLAADTAYGTGRFLGWLVGCGIAPHIPVRDASERDDGTFSRSDFRWRQTARRLHLPEQQSDAYHRDCVHGTLLRYRASKFDCDVCSLKMKCCPKTPARHVPRDLQEDARDVARRLMGTKHFLKSRDERKRVEMRFAHLKIHHGFRTHATSRSIRRARRIPSRRHCAEPQNAGASRQFAASRRNVRK